MDAQQTARSRSSSSKILLGHKLVIPGTVFFLVGQVFTLVFHRSLCVKNCNTKETVATIGAFVFLALG
ncbi:hypothetical protein SK128_018942, partial [Halocaridina rubra]